MQHTQCTCRLRGPFWRPQSEKRAEWERSREHTRSLPIPGGANTRQVVQRSESGVKRHGKFKAPSLSCGHMGSLNGSMKRPSRRWRARAAGRRVLQKSDLFLLPGGVEPQQEWHVRCTVAKPRRLLACSRWCAQIDGAFKWRLQKLRP